MRGCGTGASSVVSCQFTLQHAAGEELVGALHHDAPSWARVRCGKIDIDRLQSAQLYFAHVARQSGERINDRASAASIAIRSLSKWLAARAA